MQVSAKVLENTLYVDITGELDEHTANYVRTSMDSMLEKTGFRRVIIDLAGLEFMDSTGIGVLIGRYKKMQSKSIPVFISNPSSQADRILKMTALYDVMPKIN